MTVRFGRLLGATFVALALSALSLTVFTTAHASSLNDCAGVVRQQGSSGDCVRTLQTALNARGAHLAVDGAFGPATAAAVKAFQGSQGLVVDGIVGPKTWAALGAGAPSAAPTPQATPAPAPKTAPAPSAAPKLAPAPQVSTPAPPQGPADSKNPPAPAPVHNTVSAPAPWPPSGVYREPGPDVCLAGQRMEPIAYNPRTATDAQGRAVVQGIGGVELVNAGCGASVTFKLQTKVCGTFGCSWETKDSVTYRNLPANGALISRILSTPLRPGQNRYRVAVETNKFVLTAEEGPGEDVPGIIGIEAEGEGFYPDGVQLGY